MDADYNSNRKRKLKISTVLAKAKSWGPAYSQAFNQNKIDKQGVKIQIVRKADSQTTMVDGVWCLELRRGGRYGERG